ncbi:hypothetical protein [Butyrivibrio sp. AE2032]|uniref:hypothetical protein n=1 Tax=Butyrivibrio sp. AE2032 TaxID=1458463 RepID=UPI0005571495|nr:hypothetical protein [Butyrivibrio sp. AE2032]
MNRNIIKKAVSAVLTGAVLLGFTGCLNNGGAKKAVLEVADSLATDMLTCNAGKIIKNTGLDKKSKEAQSLTELLSDDEKTDDEKAFFKAVESTIEYEIDEESCTVNKDSASVDIVFTIVDYSSVLAEDFNDIDELTKAIKKGDTNEITFTAEFVKEDKEWVPDNVGSKKFLKLYDYRKVELDLSLSAEKIAGLIDKNVSDFWLTTDGKYVDTNFIQYDYFFASEALEYADKEFYLYFKLYKDGQVAYVSDNMLFGKSTNISCRVELGDVGLTGSIFEDGTYTIELLTADGEVVDTEIVTVEHTEITVPSGNGGGNGGGGNTTTGGEGVYFDYYDKSFKQYVIEADWFEYDVDAGCLSDGCFYDKSVQYIAFSIQVTPECDKELTYYYYYAANENELADALSGSPIFTDTISVTQYDNGYYYDIDYATNGEAQSGFYLLFVMDAETNSNILYGFCKVS